jgi:hypothetical protein
VILAVEVGDIGRPEIAGEPGDGRGGPGGRCGEDAARGPVSQVGRREDADAVAGAEGVVAAVLFDQGGRIVDADVSVERQLRAQRKAEAAQECEETEGVEKRTRKTVPQEDAQKGGHGWAEPRNGSSYPVTASRGLIRHLTEPPGCALRVRRFERAS